MLERSAPEFVRERIRSIVGMLRNLPEWGILRMSTVTGAKPGVVVVFLLAAIAGAIAAVAVTGTVYLAAGQQPEIHGELSVEDDSD